MKNTVKFFLGGAVAAALIMGVFAFTNKQNENKGYVFVRVIENAGGLFGSPHIQICDENGKYVKDGALETGKYGGVDSDGKNTVSITNLINGYAQKGYSVKSINQNSTGNYSITTILFEK